ncbi:hypothetical protein Q7P37_006444 [Cladosporium fusiforme]
MAQFRPKKLDLGCFVNIMNIRDHTKRKVFEQHEPERQALRYVIRNTSLPQRTRAQAQLQLSQMHCYTRPTQIKNRCIMGAKGRGVLRDFRMARFQFRLNALAGNIPGVKKASWRKHNDPPGEVQFPTELAKLGLKRNEKNQYVTISQPNSFVKHRQYKDEAVNVQLTQSHHKAMRKDIFAELEKLGISPYYVHQNDVHGYVEPMEPRPHAYVTILASDIKDLATKKHVFIFVGDSTQELGILSWKTTETEGGLDKGTAVGLVKEIHGTVSASSELPGVIILNPGELLWSPESGKCLSYTGWKNRTRPNAFSETFAITRHNKVRGHETPQAHVKTFLGSFVHGLVAPDTQIFVIALGDGGDSALSCLNDKFAPPTNAKICKQLAGIALVESAHDFSDVDAPALKNFLRKNARAWVASQKAQGTLLKRPEPEKLRNRSVSDPIPFKQPAYRQEQSESTLEETDFDDYMKAHHPERYEEVNREIAEEGAALPEIPVASNRPELNQEFTFPASDSTGARAVREPARIATARHRRTREVFDAQLINEPTSDLDAEDHDSDQFGAYADEPVVCSTYSAGVEDVAEMVFPGIMDRVLVYLSTKMKME